MVEIFADISSDIKKQTKTLWELACLQDDPMKAAKFIDSTLQYLENHVTEEEMEFIRFYIKMQMEKEKNG